MMKIMVCVITIVLEIIAWGYWIILVKRTHFFQHNTSLGNDTIVLMYLLCFVICVLSIYLLIKKELPQLFLILLLIAAVIPSIGFSVMNVSGNVREITKIE